jgi:hypothetical protein
LTRNLPELLKVMTGVKVQKVELELIKEHQNYIQELKELQREHQKMAEERKEMHERNEKLYDLKRESDHKLGLSEIEKYKLEAEIKDLKEEIQNLEALKVERIVEQVDDEAKERTQKKSTLSPNAQKILDILPDNEEEPLSAAEIADITEIQKTHIYTIYMKELKRHRKIEEIIDDENVKRFYQI